MELIGVDISGYKRFGEEVRMELGARLICIVGPNAAGKSSLLDALIHLNGDSEFASAERTRGGGTPCVEARFALEKEDKDLLRDVAEAKHVRQLLVRKEYEEPLAYFLEPDPERDLRNREAVAARLDRLDENAWVAEAMVAQEDDDPDAQLSVSANVEQVRLLLREDEEFDDADLDVLRSLAKCLHAVLAGEYLPGAPDLPKKFRRLPGDLDDLISGEKLGHPRDQAIERLKLRISTFVVSRGGERRP